MAVDRNYIDGSYIRRIAAALEDAVVLQAAEDGKDTSDLISRATNAANEAAELATTATNDANELMVTVNQSLTEMIEATNNAQEATNDAIEATNNTIQATQNGNEVIDRMLVLEQEVIQAKTDTQTAINNATEINTSNLAQVSEAVTQAKADIDAEIEKSTTATAANTERITTAINQAVSDVEDEIERSTTSTTNNVNRITDAITQAQADISAEIQRSNAVTEENTTQINAAIDTAMDAAELAETKAAQADASKEAADNAASAANAAAESATNAASSATAAAASANNAASRTETAIANAAQATQRIADMSATIELLGVTDEPTINYDYETSVLAIGLPHGQDASVTDSTQYYAISTELVMPTEGWSESIPSTIPQGAYLWTKVVLTWNDGVTSDLYSVNRQGVDGNGSVSSVNNYSPDSTGNVTIPVLTDEDIDEIVAAVNASE